MKYCLLLLTLLCAAVARADGGAWLWLPEEASIEAINGQPYSVGLFNLKKAIPLTVGQQAITLRYTDIQDDPLGGAHTNFRSEPVIVYFVSKAGDNYEVHLPKISNADQAARFEKRPLFTVIERESQQAVQQSVTIVPLENAPLANVLAPGVAVAANGVAAPTGSPAAPENLAASNLWFWWQQADAATRKAFLQRIGSAQ